MAFNAGYLASVYVGGTPVTLTNEATTEVTPGVLYQISNSAKRVLDPNTALLVEDAGGPVADANYTVDALTGTLTFGVAATPPVTVSGKYVPLLQVATARAGNVLEDVAMLDTTVFNAAGERSALPGLRRAEVNVEDIDPSPTNLGDGTTLEGLITGRTQAFLKFAYGNGKAFIGWGYLHSRNKNAPVAELVTAPFVWGSSVRRFTGRSEEVAFNANATA